jgi:hypothetical protein
MTAVTYTKTTNEKGQTVWLFDNESSITSRRREYNGKKFGTTFSVKSRAFGVMMWQGDYNTWQQAFEVVEQLAKAGA